MNTLFLKITTIVAYITMVVVNYMAVLIPLGGRSTGEISDNYQNLFAPAGYAFSIWGFIYILLGIYAVYQLFKNNELIAKINQIFVLNALLNASWIFAWHYNLIWLSVIIMIGLLITLIKISDIFHDRIVTQKETWLVRLPFGVYFGWITVATIANIAVFLVYIDWNKFGISEVFWTILVLLVGTFIGSWRILYDKFIPYGFVLVWAYVAILNKHISANGFSGQYPLIIWSTVLCLFIFLGTILFVSIKNKYK